MQIIDINHKERECKDAYLDPSWPGYVTVKYVSKHRKGHTHTEWYPIDKFLENNPDLAHIVGGKAASTKPEEEIAGRATGSGPDILRDSAANWGKNAYAGFQLWISRGTGEGQVRTILSNTKSALKLDKPWDRPRPNKTSQYAIIRNVIHTESRGNTLSSVDLAKLEEKARQMDMERGLTPAPKQYS